MVFTLICPNDGRIDLGLENISAVVFRGEESVEVVFECPRCGTSIRAGLHVPNRMVVAMDLARYMEELGDGDPGPDAADDDIEGPTDDAERRENERRRERERTGEPYCEYFRRQLARVECVEDLLAETD